VITAACTPPHRKLTAIEGSSQVAACRTGVQSLARSP
jgi:hypothetical protein